MQEEVYICHRVPVYNRQSMKAANKRINYSELLRIQYFLAKNFFSGFLIKIVHNLGVQRARY